MLRRLHDEKLIVSERRILRIPNLDALKAAAAFDARYLHLEGAPQAVRDAVSSHRLTPYPRAPAFDLMRQTAAGTCSLHPAQKADRVGHRLIFVGAAWPGFGLGFHRGTP